ncbi:MAG: FapA family protein [Hydrogenoanaerobacterium sp.]
MDINDNNSALFRLWQKATQKREENADEKEAQENANESAGNIASSEKKTELKFTEIKNGFHKKNDNIEDYIRMLWTYWSKDIENAPEFLPAEKWDELEASGKITMTTRIAKEHEGFYEKLQQPAREDYERIRAVLMQRQEAEKEAKEAERAARKVQMQAQAEEREGQREQQADDITDSTKENATQDDTKAAAEPPPKPVEEIPMPPIDAKVFIRTSPDKMQAWMFIMPPQNGGSGISSEALEGALCTVGITYGIDEEVLEKAAAGEIYFKLVVVAWGLLPKNGDNGYISERISDTWKIQPKQNDDGLVDYKNIGTIHNILKGTALCRIVPPTEPVDGIAVDGTIVPGLAGKVERAPQGGCTGLSEDGTQLLATEDGHVVIEGDKYVVKTTLSFNGDIDIAIGNLNFPGSIKVIGDVREGFEVRANGNIEIKGMVEGAKIISGGDIKLESGINGNNRGSLEAQGNIKSKFIENCSVYAKGSITADSIICSDVSCDEVINVRTGKGVIIGGSCTALKSIEANIIGSESNRITAVAVGNAGSVIKEKLDIEQVLKKSKSNIDEMKKSIAYVFTCGKEITNERRAQVDKMNEMLPLLEQQVEELSLRLSEINESMQEALDSRIKCGAIHPPTRVTIGTISTVVDKVYTRCNIYLSEDEIVFGSQ